MARRIDQDLFDDLVEAFRETPGNFNAVSKAVGVSWRTAKKAWLKGWPAREFGPVSKVIELEELEARANRAEADERKLAELKEDEAVNDAAIRAQARRDAIAARSEESTMVKAARLSAINLLDTSRKLGDGIRDLAPKLRDAIKRIEFAEETDLDDIERVAKLLWRLSISTRAGASTAWTILQAERLLLGQPTDIIGLTDLDNMDEREAMKELEEAAKSFERIKERRKKTAASFRVLQGGKTADG